MFVIHGSSCFAGVCFEWWYPRRERSASTKMDPFLIQLILSEIYACIMIGLFGVQFYWHRNELREVPRVKLWFWSIGLTISSLLTITGVDATGGLGVYKEVVFPTIIGVFIALLFNVAFCVWMYFAVLLLYRQLRTEPPAVTSRMPLVFSAAMFPIGGTMIGLDFYSYTAAGAVGAVGILVLFFELFTAVAMFVKLRGVFGDFIRAQNAARAARPPPPPQQPASPPPPAKNQLTIELAVVDVSKSAGGAVPSVRSENSTASAAPRSGASAPAIDTTHIERAIRTLGLFTIGAVVLAFAFLLFALSFIGNPDPNNSDAATANKTFFRSEPRKEWSSSQLGRGLPFLFGNVLLLWYCWTPKPTATATLIVTPATTGAAAPTTGGWTKPQPQVKIDVSGQRKQSDQLNPKDSPLRTPLTPQASVGRRATIDIDNTVNRAPQPQPQAELNSPPTTAAAADPVVIARYAVPESNGSPASAPVNDDSPLNAVAHS